MNKRVVCGIIAAIFLLFGRSSLQAQAASAAIGGETALPPLPTSDYWAQLVPTSPGSNQVVTVNPPVFSWLYAPEVAPYSVYDYNVYQYIFQADYDGSFANPVVNVTTFSDCYNFLAPFNAGSTVYWRVGYLSNGSNNFGPNYTATGWVTNAWITNSFTIAPNATNWDRSVLANPSYMAGKTHPYIMFNGTNNLSIGSYCALNDSADWNAAISGAQQTMSSSWWTNSAPWSGSVNYPIMAGQIAQVAYLWMATGNPTWTNQLCANFDNLIGYFTNAGLNFLDYGNGADPALPISMAVCYDWLYPMLSPTERNNAVQAMELQLRGDLVNGFWVAPKLGSMCFFPGGRSDPTEAYPGPYWVPYAIPSKMGNSHPWMNAHAAAFYLALATFNDNPDSSQFLNLYLNYLIGRVTPYGAGAVNQGRSYAYVHTFFCGTVDNNLFAGTIFPEANLTKNPAFNELADWWMRMAPPGYDQIHEQFGDVNFGQDAQFWRPPSGARDFALLTQNPYVAMAGQQVNQLMGYYSRGSSWGDMTYPYFYPTPPTSLNWTLGVAYPDEGWAFGSTYPPNSTNCFFSGVGFAMMARPRGSEAGHSDFSDLDFEIWAYGANITDGSGGSYVGNRASWAHNTVQINGLGQAETEAQPMSPVVAQIVAFTNAPDYVYVAADATQAYPHQPFLYDLGSGGNGPSGWLVGQFGSLLTSGPLSYVSAVRRELLFEHHKYFVIYDTIQTTNAPTNTFSWVYHVFQDTVSNLNGGSFQYTAPVWSFTGGGVAGLQTGNNSVTTYVFQVVNPAEVNSVNMHGTSAYSNPFTGENYYANAMNDLTNGTGNAISTNSIWVSNLTPTNKFHFMTVIFPVAPGAPPPSFTALDDNTVAVTNGGQVDVITFDPNDTNAVTLTVNSPGVWAASAPIPQPPVLSNPAFIQATSPITQAVTLATPASLHVIPPTATNVALTAQITQSFAPVGNYAAWWNPDTLSGTNFAPISSWVDVSANGFNSVQTTFINEPVLMPNAQNGHNYVVFSGASSLTAALANIPQPFEIFAVASAANLNFNGFVAGSAALPPMGLGVYNDTFSLSAGDGLGGGVEATNWMEMTAIVNDANSQVFVNGTQVIAPGQRAGGDPLTGITIGAMYNSGGLSHFWNGNIGDIIIYTNILGPSDQQTVENGLHAKYGF